MKHIFFEPWSLGDALIAAWAARQWRDSGGDPVLACANRFHEVVHGIYPDLPLVAVDLRYTTKDKGSFREELSSLKPSDETKGLLLSIRGDPRDLLSGSRIFPGIRKRFSGWESFVCRRAAWADLPFRQGWLSVANRYDRWCRLLKLPLPARKVHAPAAGAKRAVIHLGAQWVSKRYPEARALGERLRKLGHSVELIAGPGDLRLPDPEVEVLMGEKLIQFLQSRADYLVANDSAPMHLGFALGIPTLSIFGNTGVDEWAPPNALVVGGEDWKGYRPHYRYAADEPHADPKAWPSVSRVIERLKENGWIAKTSPSTP